MFEDKGEIDTSGTVGNDGSFERISFSILSVGEVIDQRVQRASSTPVVSGRRNRIARIEDFELLAMASRGLP
jgi:hypothetical protein